MEKELDFKPMTEGLGFHPFSDGLPYAPLSKTSTRVAGTDMETASARARTLLGSGAAGPVTPRQPGAASLLRQQQQQPSGTGAVAAGQPRFATRLPVNVAPPRAPQSAGPVVGFSRPALPMTPGPTVTVARPAPAPAAEQTPSEEFWTQTHFGFFYLIKRFLAYGLDSALNIALCVGALGAVGSRLGVSPEALSNPSMAVLSISFLLTFNWAMIAGQEVIFKTTIGKRLFGLHLNGSGSALFLRAFFFLPSAGFSMLGVLWALFDSRRRCWHDHVVDVQPEES